MKDYIPEIEFDPNGIQKESFATYRPRRSPKFKLHSKLGNARNAAKQGGPSIVYEWKNGKWEVIEEHFRNVACTICGLDYRKNGPHFIAESKEVTTGSGQWARTYTQTTSDKVWNVTKDRLTSGYYSFDDSDRGAHDSCVNRAEHMSKPIKDRLSRCVGLDTAVDYEDAEKSGNLWRGQCVPVSLIVQDELGGEILRTQFNDGESHYWNLVDGVHIDLTAEQYPDLLPSEIHIDYKLRTRDYLLGNPDVKKRYKLLRGLYDSVSVRV